MHLWRKFPLINLSTDMLIKNVLMLHTNYKSRRENAEENFNL